MSPTSVKLLPTIESLQNPKIKRVVRLREATTRRKLGRFLIDGQAEIQHAIRQGFELEAIYVNELGSGFAEAEMGAQRPVLQPVSAKVLARIAYGQREDNPVAVAHTPSLELSRLQLSPQSLLLVLDRTEKPGNLGACLRTASACGVDAVVLSDPICEPWNPNAIRASRGTLFSVPLATASRQQLLELCQQLGLRVFAARVDGSTRLWDQDFRGGAAIVFGSEAHGLGPEWSPEGMQTFQIPMRGAADSLNLSISAAVTLYEVFRQRSL